MSIIVYRHTMDRYVILMSLMNLLIQNIEIQKGDIVFDHWYNFCDAPRAGMYRCSVNVYYYYYYYYYYY